MIRQAYGDLPRREDRFRIERASRTHAPIRVFGRTGCAQAARNPEGSRRRLGSVLICCLQCFEYPIHFILGVVMDESDAEEAAVVLYS